MHLFSHLRSMWALFWWESLLTFPICSVVLNQVSKDKLSFRTKNPKSIIRSEIWLSPKLRLYYEDFKTTQSENLSTRRQFIMARYIQRPENALKRANGEWRNFFVPHGSFFRCLWNWQFSSWNSPLHGIWWVVRAMAMANALKAPLSATPWRAEKFIDTSALSLQPTYNWISCHIFHFNLL